MKVLILDNNIDKEAHGAKDLVKYAYLAPSATFYVRRPPDSDLPPDHTKFDKVIISGSKTGALEDAPWIERYFEFVKKLLDSGKPILGICYGHQTIARILGNKDYARRSPTPEFGWTLIERDANSVIFEGLPKTFYVSSSHFDEVTKLPHGAKLLAHSKRCAIQAYELTGKQVYCIQFHPETGVVGTARVYKFLKMQKQAHLFEHYKDGEKYFNPKVPETIFRNFLKL